MHLGNGLINRRVRQQTELGVDPVVDTRFLFREDRSTIRRNFPVWPPLGIRPIGLMWTNSSGNTGLIVDCLSSSSIYSLTAAGFASTEGRFPRALRSKVDRLKPTQKPSPSQPYPEALPSLTQKPFLHFPVKEVGEGPVGHAGQVRLPLLGG